MLNDLIAIYFPVAVLAAVALSFIYEEKTRILPVPTLPVVTHKILALAKQLVPESSAPTIVELGCGWGGMMAHLRRLFPSSLITGYEFSPLPFLVSWLRGFWLGKSTIVLRRDFFKESLGGYQLIICYLSPWHMKKLHSKFLAECKPGTIIISNAFPLPDLVPVASEEVFVLGTKIGIFAYRL